MSSTAELADRIAEASSRHHVDPDRNDRAQDADTCACGVLVDDWDRHWAEAALAAIRGAYVPPPPGSGRDALPEHLRALIGIYMGSYVSTGCRTGNACASLALADPALAGQLADWEQRGHDACRLTRKQDMARCTCPCHRETP